MSVSDRVSRNPGYSNNAKWFTLDPAGTCDPEKPIGCDILVDEEPLAWRRARTIWSMVVECAHL